MVVYKSHELALEANWREEVAKDIQLLRRAGPYQLALLSHLRRDDKILPVMKAVWLHSLHTSCPSEIGFWNEICKIHWRPVAESLLKDVLGSYDQWQTGQSGTMLSPLYAFDVHSLEMPGSSLVMQVMLPMQNLQGLRDKHFFQLWLDQTTLLAEVLQRCLPVSLWEVVQAVGEDMRGENLGLLAEDVITEIAARACAALQDWPGKTVFQSVRSHLHSVVSVLMHHVLHEGEERDYPGALLPAVAAMLLLPMSQSVVALQVKLSSLRTASHGDFSKLRSVLMGHATWQTIRDYGLKVVLQLHAADLEESLRAPFAGRNLKDFCMIGWLLCWQRGILVQRCVVASGGWGTRKTRSDSYKFVENTRVAAYHSAPFSLQACYSTAFFLCLLFNLMSHFLVSVRRGRTLCSF